MMKKKNLALFIILSIVTLGIYPLFFWYKWTKDLNKLCAGDDRDSANYLLVVLLNIFSLGIYSPIWNYQMAERLYQKAGDYGVEIKHGGFFVMIWRFLPLAGDLVSDIYKIIYINKLIDGYNAQFNGAAAPEAEAADAEVAEEEADVVEVAAE